MKIADTHAHHTFPTYQADLVQTLQSDQAAGVEFCLEIGCDEVSSKKALHLAQQFPSLWACPGLHPCSVADFFRGKIPNELEKTDHEAPTVQTLEPFLAWLETVCQQASEQRVLALGETGLDLYHESSAEILDWQKQSLDGHLDLATKYDLPLVFHVRAAQEPFIAHLRAYQKSHSAFPRGIMHCFDGDETTAQIYTQEFGFLLGVGGRITYPNAEPLRQTLAQVDLSMIVTETDAPFLVPQESRAQKIKRNESRFILQVLQTLAQLHQMPVSQVADRLWHNAQQFLRF